MKIRFSIALPLLLPGCPSETVGPPPAPPVNWASLDAGVAHAPPVGPTKSEREAADAYVAGLAAPSFDGLMARLDGDVHFAFPGLDDCNGKQAVVRAHDRLLGAFDSRKVTALRIWRTADEQTVELRVTGVQTRDWMGIKASQKPVSVRALALLWTKDDGSISDLHLYFDVAAIKAQLGIGPRDLLTAVEKSTEDAAPASPQLFEQASPATPAAPVVVARAALDALEKNDLQAYEATITDGIEIHTLERSQPWRGRSDVSAYFKALHAAVGQLDTTVTDARGIGDFAIVEYTIAGEQLGPIGPVPAQRDRTVVLHVVDIVAAPTGKIATIWRYDNPSEIAATPPS